MLTDSHRAFLRIGVHQIKGNATGFISFLETSDFGGVTIGDRTIITNENQNGRLAILSHKCVYGSPLEICR